MASDIGEILELKCEACEGFGKYYWDFNSNSYFDDTFEQCKRCNGTGIDYPKLQKWLSDPNNNPNDYIYKIWHQIENKWHYNPLITLIDEWFLTRNNPPIYWATIIASSFEFGGDNV